MIDNKYGILPLNLQFFADGDGSTGDEGGGNGENTNTPPADLNTLLKGDKTLQSQYDKLIAKALSTAKAKWEQEQKMSEEERMSAKAKEREDAIKVRERELERRERKATALESLTAKELSAGLIDCINLDDDDAMQASIDALEKAYRKSVDDAVKAKLKGNPPKDTGSTGSAYEAKIRAAMGLKAK